MKRFLAFLGSVAFLVLAFILYWHWTSGVRVTVVNIGHTPMRDIQLIVTGNRYALGNLGAGESRSIRVQPMGESHLEIDYSNSQSNNSHLVVDCYMEGGYRGSLKVEVDEGKIEKVTERIAPWPAS